MELVKNPEFQCRVCLQASSELISLFSINEMARENGLTNAYLLMEFTSVKILENDPLPANICKPCYQKLSQCYEFKKLCENSDQILHSFRIEVKQELHDQSEDDKIVSNSETYEHSYSTCYLPQNNQSDYLKHLQKNYLSEIKRKISRRLNLKNKKITSDLENYIKLKYAPIELRDDDTNDFRAKHCRRCYKNYINDDQHQIICPLLKCTLCEKTLRANCTLKLHMIRHHSTEKICHRCNQQYPSHVNHDELCTKMDNECSYCGLKLKTPVGLKYHIRIHTNEKPVKCKLCDKTFLSYSSRRDHVRRLHTGEKNYSCDKCGKSFFTKSHLKAHFYTHVQVRNYSCEMCEAKFKDELAVRRHMSIHNDEKKFVCEDCGKKFTVQGGLKVHRRTHHGEKRYKCENCSEGFVKRVCLRAHMLKVHQLVLPSATK